MRRSALRRAGAVGLIGLYLTLAQAGCQGRSGEEASRGAREVGELRPVALPGLDAFDEAVREQLRAQHARLQELAAVADLDPSRLGEAYGVLGQHLYAYDLNLAAEPALLNAADLDREDARWHYYLGRLYKSEGRLQESAHHFERAHDARPDDVPVRINLALIYRDLGRDEDAKQILLETVRIDPQNAVAFLLLGHLTADEAPAEAIEFYETVLRLQPEASVARYPLAVAYRKLGDLERSREHMEQRGNKSVSLSDPYVEQLESIRKGAGAKIFQGDLYMRHGRYRDAADLYAQAAAADSTNVSAFLNLAVAVAQLGETSQAIEALERVLRLDPRNTRALYDLGVLHGLGGDEEKAVEYLRAAVDSDPANREARIALANLLWRRRDCRQAILHLKIVLASNPGLLESRMRQAICHAHLEEYADARALLEAGYEAYPQLPLLQDAMVRILAASPDRAVRDGERAVAMAERLVSSFRRPEVFESLAMAYAEVGRFSEAIQLQEQVIRAAEEQGLASMLDYLRNNLRLYQAGRPCRTPWPPAVFER